jgi:hypothetical protein
VGRGWRHTFFPGMPYAHKYANAVTEDGMVAAIRRFLPDEGLLDSVWRGGRSPSRKDVEGVVAVLVDAEMKERTFRPIAMSVPASGAIPPRGAGMGMRPP